jgi:hypothetical protein
MSFMSATNYRSASFRSIFLGIAIFFLLLVVFLFLPDFIKVIGYPFLWIPDRLNIVAVPDAGDVQKFDLAVDDQTVDFAQPGNYVAYTGDTDLLLTNDSLAEKNSVPWLLLQGPGGAEISPRYVERGLMPFDSPFAKGRPVLTFQIQTPGHYTLTHPHRQAIISILPDAVSGQEGWLWTIYIVELALIGFVVWKIAGRRRLKQQARVKEIDGLKRIQGDDFWKAEMERKNRKRMP